jgi:hypothetical protein
VAVGDGDRLGVAVALGEAGGVAAGLAVRPTATGMPLGVAGAMRLLAMVAPTVRARRAITVSNGSWRLTSPIVTGVDRSAEGLMRPEKENAPSGRADGA